MARGKTKTRKRKVEPDFIYGNLMVTKLINRSMKDGKKSVAQKQIYKAFEILEKQGKKPMEVFQEALKNITPQMEVRARRIGGAAYQVPTPVRNERKISLSIRWLITEARKRSNKDFKTYAEKLAAEISEAAAGEGSAFKKKEVMHKMAEANRAFSHFRW